MSPGARAGVEAEQCPGDQGEGSLGADDELGQVVAARGLHEPPPGGDHLARAEDGLESQDVVAGDAVLDRPHATGVGGHVAPEAGRLFAGEHGVDQPHRGEGGVELRQCHPRLDHGDLVGHVDLEDRRHPLERDHDPALDGCGGPGEPGARAAGGHGDPERSGGLHHGRHLGGRSRPHHRQWPRRSQPQRLVMAQVVGHGLTQVDVDGPGDGHQPVPDHPCNRPAPMDPTSSFTRRHANPWYGAAPTRPTTARRCGLPSTGPRGPPPLRPVGRMGADGRTR